MAYSIDVDFDVYKEITSRRETESVSPNDVLRRLLSLPANKTEAAGRQHTIESTQEATSWVVKGVRFPEGTEFHATHKGQSFTGQARSGGLLVNGKTYGTPSAAAVAITGNPVNGWRFWQCRLPGRQTWTTIEALRNDR